MNVFDERYRVISVEDQHLVIQGIRTGEVLTIRNNDPDSPLKEEDFPLGKLIALTDPSIRAPQS